MNRRRARRSGNDPVALDAMLSRVNAELTGVDHGAVAQLIDAWTEIIGPGIAEGVSPQAVVDGVLTVIVSDPARRAQLAFEEPEIVTRINAHFGRPIVRAVRVMRPGRPEPRPGVW